MRTLSTAVRSLLAAACLAGLAGCGILDPRPEGTVSIAGTVTYADGSVVYRAKVNLSSGEETYTDRLGRYSLRTRASERLTVSARDGFTPGWVYGTTYSGSVSIAGDRDRRVDLRLVVPTPF